MHAAYTLAAIALLAAACNAVTPTATGTHHLVRRQIPFDPLSVGIGAGAVHKHHANEALIIQVKHDIAHLHAELDSVNADNRLERRIVGTALGAVSVSKARKMRKEIDTMETDVDHMREEVNDLMHQNGIPVPEVEEGETKSERKERKKAEKKAAKAARKAAKHGHQAVEHEEEGGEHRLERRQLGLVLAPVGMHKVRNNRRSLLRLQERVANMHRDLGRVRAAKRSHRPSRGGNGNYRGGKRVIKVDISHHDE